MTDPISAHPLLSRQSEPPQTVRLKVCHLLHSLPAGIWTGTEADANRELTLPAAEILATNLPRIRFRRLCEELPGCFKEQAGAPEWIPLPAGPLALAYSHTRPLAPGAKPPAPVRLPSWKRLPKPLLAPPPASSSETTASQKSVHLAEMRFSQETQALLQSLLDTPALGSPFAILEHITRLLNLRGCALYLRQDSLLGPAFPAECDADSLVTQISRLLTVLRREAGSDFPPILTLHPAGGACSVLEAGDWRLLILHREGEFTPGVWEKLRALLQALPPSS